jgi:hypothetical protein
MQLRYLQTLTQVSAANNETVIVPTPLSFFRALEAFGGPKH